MTGRLHRKVALVTGAGSGIGRAATLTFVREGAKVLATDINLAGAEATVKQLSGGALAHRMDVSSETEWITAVALAIKTFGKLDIVANVAGIGCGGTIEDVELKDWNALIAVNLTGVMLGCKHGVKGIVRSGGAGAIVNVSSMGALSAPADIAAYCATKGGVTTLTRSVAMHCAEKRYPVRCVSIHPTYVDTEMLDPVVHAAGGDREALLTGMARLIPMGRMAKPQDIANAILFAASDEAAMISGSGLLVDGAQLAGPRSTHFQ